MAQIRVTLRRIKILDNLEPFFKETGEFRFRPKVSSEAGEGFSRETRFPEEGHYSLSDKPGQNYVTLNKTLYEGKADENLAVPTSSLRTRHRLASTAIRLDLPPPPGGPVNPTRLTRGPAASTRWRNP
jgi:hypothetical protein